MLEIKDLHAEIDEKVAAWLADIGRKEHVDDVDRKRHRREGLRR